MHLSLKFFHFCVAALAMLVFAFTLTPAATAQTETVLYTFTGSSDGAAPQGNLISDSHGNWYGTNALGGTFGGNCFVGCGNVFELSPNGSGGWTETVLYNFQGSHDGAVPEASLSFDSAGNLYGTTVDGGYLGDSTCELVYPGCGVVFKLTPNGSGGWTESVLHTFGGGVSGYLPQSTVVFDASGNLYGSADLGGAHSVGLAFQLSPNGHGGWNFKNIYNFTNGTDGGRPQGLAIDSHGNLFMTTSQGGNTTSVCGSDGCGSLVEISPDGSGGWTAHAIHTFTSNRDGSVPLGVSIDGKGNLFGVAIFGGNLHNCQHLGVLPGCGVIYELSPRTGGGWTDRTVYFFTGREDGANPRGTPTVDSTGNVYATSNDGVAGCPSSCGAVVKLSPISGGWSETTLYTFTGGADGSEPAFNGVTPDDSGNLFGTVTAGGDLSCVINGPPGCGVAYKITP